MPENADKNHLQSTLDNFTTIEQALIYFEMSFDNAFIEQHGKELAKRFMGNIVLGKADDWFSGRRALKNAYCKIQRGHLDQHTRSACRGCTTCERR